MSRIALNLGSGQRPFGKEWINIDIQEKWKPDIVADCDKLDMFQGNSVDMIVCHHMLEHRGCGEGRGMLKECYRVLKPNASLLVFVPDMWHLAGKWRRGELSDQLYMTAVYGAYMGDEADRHAWGYTRQTLRSELKEAGFPIVVDFDWRHIPGADIARADWILGMEAIK